MEKSKSIKSDVVNIKTGKPIRLKKESFFHKDTCDRCSNPLDCRKLSWFNEDIICMECSAKELDIKKEYKKLGGHPDDLEGFGYCPDKSKLEEIYTKKAEK